MATGANIQQGRGIQVTNLPPQADLRDGSAEAWDGIRRTADRLRDAAKPDLIRRAQELGAADGVAIAAGEMARERSIFSFGEVAAAREQALQGAFIARTRTDIDTRDDELRREFRYDPEGYENAAREMVSGFIQGSPPDFAVDVETYARSRASNGLSVVANARSVRDEQEVVQAFQVRAATLDERLIALGSKPDGMNSPEYAAALTEREALQDQREGNPAILYSPEQRAADDEKLLDGVQSANVARLAVETHTTAGGGLAGYAAGMRFLNEEVLQGEAFADMDPGRLQRVYRDAASQLRDFSAADREEQRLQDEQERAQRAERRELVGELRLGVLLGEVDEDAIRSNPTLTDADKAGLVSSVRAAARRDAAEIRAVEALERAGRNETYNQYRDDAQAGTLTSGEIADGVNAGLISPGRAQTLRTLNDRALAPVIEDVMAPVRDASNRPGASSRGNASQIAVAEEAAAIFARANPDATLEQRLVAGRVIAERVMGTATAGRPTSATSAAQGQSAALSALSAERTRRQSGGNRMTTAEYNRRRNEIIHGR